MGDSSSSLWQLTSVRFKEFIREPEALFWSLGFPILLAIGLGIAFRCKPADVVHVAVVDAGAPTQAIVAALRSDKLLAVEQLSPDSAAVALRTGRVALVVVPAGDTAVHYEFDDARPDARTAINGRSGVATGARPARRCLGQRENVDPGTSTS